jgi:hypothetical protein
LFITGQSGSGVSTALEGVLKGLKTTDTKAFILPQSGMEPGLSPADRLLRHFGFLCSNGNFKSVGSTLLSEPVINLAEMLGPAILLVEDSLNGVIGTGEIYKHLNMWRSLTLPPSKLRIVLGGPANRIMQSWSDKDELSELLWIPQWDSYTTLELYLCQLSQQINENFDVHMNLADHSHTILKVSRGNTALLVERVKHLTVNTLLSGMRCLNSNFLDLPLRDVIHSNAKLLASSLS